jgi:PAS domain S-box-containing protein
MRCESSLTPPDLMKEVWRSLRAGASWTGELAGQTRDGRRRHMLAAWSPVAGRGAVSLGFIGLFEDVTLRKEQERSLRSREKLLSDLLDASPDAMLMMDATGKVRLCNRQALAMFGYARDDLLRAHVTRLIPCWPAGASLDELVAMANASRQPEGTGEGMDARRRDGSGFPIELTVSAFDEKGKQRIVASVRDVMARRYAERCMLELLDQRRAIFANAPPMMFSTDGVIRSVNPAFVALFRASDEDLLGKPTGVLCGSPEVHTALVARVGPALARGEAVREDTTMCRLDGTAFEARLTGQAVRMGGHGQAAVWMIEDVSEIRRAEAAMRETRERLETAQIAGNVGVWEMDAVLGRNYWTPHLERMFGFEPGQFGGGHDDFVRTLHPDDRQQVMVRAVEMLKSDSLHYREAARVIRVDGAVRWLQTEANVYRGPDRRVVRMVGVVIDITEQKSAHAEMQRAKELAEEVAALKSDFLANVSHEIRTPMNAIKGMTHLALRSDLNSQQREYLEKIEQSNRQLMRIINDMLDFSSIESGHMTLAPAAFGLDAMLRTVMDAAVPKALARQLRLVCDVAPSVPRQLVGDPLRIGQMLGQLLDNALRP